MALGGWSIIHVWTRNADWSWRCLLIILNLTFLDVVGIGDLNVPPGRCFIFTTILCRIGFVRVVCAILIQSDIDLSPPKYFTVVL